MLPQPLRLDLSTPPAKRVFHLEDGSTYTLIERKGGTLVNGVFQPGYSIEELAERQQIIWKVMGIAYTEEPCDHVLTVNGEPIGGKTTAEDALAWFEILQATLARSIEASGTVVTVRQDGLAEPIMATA